MNDDVVENENIVAETMVVHVRHEYMKFFSLDFAPEYLVFENFQGELEAELGALLCLLRPQTFSNHPFPDEERVFESVPVFASEVDAPDEDDPDSPEE